MKQGSLSQYFSGVAAKVLSHVETNIHRSHQHEFNGISKLKEILGEPNEPKIYPTKFIYISDNEEDFSSEYAYLTWYDSRKKAKIERNVMRSEYRLYFTHNTASTAAQVGDLLVIAKNKDDSLLAIIAAKDSTSAKQLCWMFGFNETLDSRLSVLSENEISQAPINLAKKHILQQIGIEIDTELPGDLDLILTKFGDVFPTTMLFSSFVRTLVQDISCLEEPDTALMAWMEREEVLYRTLERHLLTKGLTQLMQDQNIPLNPEPFIKIVQSTLQRRKSRAGAALENHLENIFQEHGIKYTRTGITENRLKPDFIFPSIEDYKNSSFPQDCLTMLGAKTTCKDRWRQILNEAKRISHKHLVTIEPSISEHQTEEMKLENVQLVVPKVLHNSFSTNQKNWIMSISNFIDMIKKRNKISKNIFLC